VIAVAFVGFMMLTGRMNWKHGITVIIGCFILFGAATIVGGIQSAAQASAG
jgi:type IV secretion system protein VirB2